MKKRRKKERGGWRRKKDVSPPSMNPGSATG